MSSCIFEHHGIPGGTLYSERGGQISRLIFDSNETILLLLEHLAPVLRMKKKQAQATIEYLSDGLTGSAFLAIVNQEIDEGRRSGKKHSEDQPWMRSNGIEKVRADSMAKARVAYQMMRLSPLGKELERARAVERNRKRSVVIQRRILLLLDNRKLTTTEVSTEISRSRPHTRIMLKEMYERNLVARSREGVHGQFRYTLSQLGRDYLSGQGLGDVGVEQSPAEGLL